MRRKRIGASLSLLRYGSISFALPKFKGAHTAFILEEIGEIVDVGVTERGGDTADGGICIGEKYLCHIHFSFQLICIGGHTEFPLEKLLTIIGRAENKPRKLPGGEYPEMI